MTRFDLQKIWCMLEFT